MAKKKKKKVAVRLEIASLKPEGTQYKHYDVEFRTPYDEPIFVEFELDEDDVSVVVTDDGEKETTITLEALYEKIAEPIHLATKVTRLKTKAARDKALTKIA